MASAEGRTGRFGIGDVLLLVVSIVFLVGIVAFFGPCGPKDDGTWMSCHWAGQAVTGLAAVLVVISVVHAVVPDNRMKAGLSAAAIPVAVLAAALPGNLIDLCMMADMHCRAVMQPSTMLVAVLMVVAAIIDLVLQLRKPARRR